MTQSASPSQITLSGMRDLFVQKFPDLVEPFDQVKPELEGSKGAQAVANLIGCEVTVHDDQGFSTYRWTGRSGPFEMKVPKPFDPQPQRASEPQQQAQVQNEEPEPETPHEAPQSAPESSVASEARDDPPELPDADLEGHNATSEKAAEPEPAPPAPTAQGLFAALAALVGDSTLLMTVAKTGTEGEEPVLTVTVVPQAEAESFKPVCLEGSVSELDTHFVAALTTKAESRKSLEQAVAEAKAADKELEEAKKVEAEAKRKQAANKKKAAEKKDDDKKLEKEDDKASETVEAAPPEPPKPQSQPLF
jgi:PRTRC genetic system protein E